ncbi:MAG: hypothetical protein ABIH23_22380 [bacterium]
MSSLLQQDIDRHERAPREESGLLCFVICRATHGPFSAEIVNESRTGCLVRSFANLPEATLVSVLVSGYGSGFQRVREGNHIFHAVVVREDRADTSYLYGLKKINHASSIVLN